MEINGFDNLEKIVVKKDSLNNLNSLKVCNCEKLKSIEIENGETWQENDKWYNSGTLFYVKSVIIESTLWFDFDVSIFLIYNHS